MPFAGQIVVPSYLPTHSTMSNYLLTVPGAMQGLVKHPFKPELDDVFKNIDPQIPVSEDSVEDVIARILAGRFDDPASFESVVLKEHVLYGHHEHGDNDKRHRQNGIVGAMLCSRYHSCPPGE